jgi:hypothetical protein
MWCKRNNATALALAEQEVTPKDYESAWKSLRQNMGEPPREMSLVSKHLDKIATPRQPRADEVSRRHPVYKPEGDLPAEQRSENLKRLNGIIKNMPRSAGRP